MAEDSPSDDDLGRFALTPVRKGVPQPRAETSGFRKWALFSRWMLMILSLCLFVAGAISLWYAQSMVLGVLALGAASVLVLITEWRWTHSEFCPACGARVRAPFSQEKESWCPGCWRLLDRGAVTVGSCDWIAVDEYATHADPYAKLVGLLLKFAMEWRASRIVLSPQDDRFRIQMARETETAELVPTPAETRPFVLQVIQTIAGFEEEANRSQAKDVRLQSQGCVLGARIAIDAARAGEATITIEFSRACPEG